MIHQRLCLFVAAIAVVVAVEATESSTLTRGDEKDNRKLNRDLENTNWGEGGDYYYNGGGGGWGGGGSGGKPKPKPKPHPKPKGGYKSKPKPKPKPKPHSYGGGGSWGPDGGWGGPNKYTVVSVEEVETTSAPTPTPLTTSAPTLLDVKSDAREVCDCSDYNDNICNSCLTGGSCPDLTCADECCEVKTCRCRDYDNKTCKACFGGGSCPDEDCAEACCTSYDYTADGDSFKPKDKYSYNTNGNSYRNKKALAANDSTTFMSNISAPLKFTFITLIVGAAAAALAYVAIQSRSNRRGVITDDVLEAPSDENFVRRDQGHFI